MFTLTTVIFTLTTVTNDRDQLDVNQGGQWRPPRGRGGRTRQRLTIMIDRRVRPPVSVWLTIMIDKMATNRWLVVPRLTTAAPPTSSNHIAINFHHNTFNTLLYYCC